MQHRTHKKKDLIEDDPQAGLSPYEKWKVKTDVRCLSIHQNAAWAIIVHPSYFFQRQLSFVLSHQWDWLICIGILFERFPFMAVFFTQVLREGHIAKWTESWHSWALKDREKWTASYLYQNEKNACGEMSRCYAAMEWKIFDFNS